MKAVPYILGISQGVVKEVAGYSHTPAFYVSKPGSRLGAGKKQPRVWLQYVCGVTEMFLDEPSGRAERLYPSLGAPLVFPWFPIGDSEMARNGVEEGSKVYASNSVELS